MKMLYSYRLFRRGLILGILCVGLFVVLSLETPKGSATPMCDSSVYEFCFSQGRGVDSTNCICDTSVCLGIAESDCTEIGEYLNTSTCTCAPGNMTPWCSGSVANQCFNENRPINPITCSCDPVTEDGGMPQCSFESYVWCQEHGGIWGGGTCLCGFEDTNQDCTASSADIDSCVTHGGVWNYSRCVCDFP
jgi:hypothetical protein